MHTGGSTRGDILATILKFDPTSVSWSRVGKMTKARSSHGASVVRAKEVEQFCK